MRENEVNEVRVLIIDPSKVSRLILQTALRRAGIASAAYPDGWEAVQALGERPDLDPDLVLLEVEFPGGDGYRLVQQLKGETRLSHCTYILLSRRDGILDRIKGRLSGAKDYVTKPFETAQVVAMVRTYLSAQPEQDTRAAGPFGEKDPVPH